MGNSFLQLRTERKGELKEGKNGRKLDIPRGKRGFQLEVPQK
jgi:hypothetical protein